jgi:uncharacterized protein (DUF433 family)
MEYQRITVDADQMGGLPCIRGLRIPVASVIAMVTRGMTEAEILEALPDLEPEDIREALCFLEDLEPEDGVFAVPSWWAGRHADSR